MKSQHTSVRYYFGSLLAGIILGALIISLYYQQKQAETEQRTDEIIDFVISEWTRTAPDETIESESTLAQLRSNPTYRLGTIPDSIRALAVMVEEKYKVPRAVTLSQYILESRWGKNDLGVNNVFGHTFAATGKYSELKKWVSRTETMLYKRTLRFTVYKNIEECFDVHGKYLSTSKLYRAAFYTNTPENFARVLAMHYAEDPDYATKLITIIRRYKL